MNNKQTFPVAEIFGPTIQGEGPAAGLKVMFLRLNGCDMKCSWCDSKFTWSNNPDVRQLTAHQIAEEVKQKANGATTLVITGGNPVLHYLEELVVTLHHSGIGCHIETQGTVFHDWLHLCEIVVVSPKPPSSGVDYDITKLQRYLTELHSVVVKTPIFTDEDYRWWKTNIYPLSTVQCVSVGNNNVDSEESIVNNVLSSYKELVTKICDDEDISNVTVLPQLHTLIWNNEQGV